MKAKRPLGNRYTHLWKEKILLRSENRSREEGSGVRTLQIGRYSGLDSS